MGAVSSSPSMITMAVSLTIYDIFGVQKIAWSWKLLFKVIENATVPPYTTFYWSAIVTIALSGTVLELFEVKWYRDLEVWVWGHTRWFELVPFECLDVVSCLPYIVTMALSCIICEILVENHDLERTVTLFSRWHHYLTLNTSQTATDTVILTVEG